MFYIVPSGDELNTAQHPEFTLLTPARQYAEHLHSRTGKHYRIVEIRNIWNTWTENVKIKQVIGG